ncbi:phospholipid carrier-dependent glycosyltransferase [Urbifossiella limnaea]|uniref:Dolichyl-phosphate-mannose-protein mannosyltransferase n=1 Tax=Urbifossiella limnaea TaxID=2528023 RepID=A0A517XZW8_9BACT|nr:phospholipid carrier-dependent glycosyltransferase [Urbifossiella limnaea]QDU23023.1 Dolichyl-phosphate-mannose-protein mannosyltransferase [Urbifossiella limnaea]
MTRNALALLAAAGLVAGFWRQGERAIAANGPTFDEVAHLAAGFGYWVAGDFALNPEHPPLLKLWWALPLLVGDAPEFPRQLARDTNDHWQVALAWGYAPGVTYPDFLAAPRRMNLALGAGVALLAGWWAYRLWDSRLAGVAAVAFAATDPTLVSLACVLSTDVGLTFFALLSAYLLWEYATKPSRGLLVGAGMSLGLMLGSKLSALGMVGALGLAGVVVLLRGGRLALTGAPDTGKRLGPALDLAFRLGLIAFVTLAATYGFVHFGEWGRGLKFQLTRAQHGDGVMYLCGELSRTGWLHYFLVAVALKLPLGLLLGSAGGLASGAWRVTWLVVPPLAFVAVASWSRVDLGVRVVLPAIPFLYVIAGRLVAGRGNCVAVAALVWAAVAARQAEPYPLAYFNELAGGNGTRYLADSNADWGQGLPALRDWMAANGVAAVQLGYFGTDRPEAYGIRYEALPGYGRVGPPSDVVLPPGRRFVVVSVNHLRGLYLPDPDTYAALREQKPVAILAGSLVVFDVTD